MLVKKFRQRMTKQLSKVQDSVRAKLLLSIEPKD